MEFCVGSGQVEGARLEPTALSQRPNVTQALELSTAETHQLTSYLPCILLPCTGLSPSLPSLPLVCLLFFFALHDLHFCLPLLVTLRLSFFFLSLFTFQFSSRLLSAALSLTFSSQSVRFGRCCAAEETCAKTGGAVMTRLCPLSDASTSACELI